jgi:hypothetical protein
MLIAGQVATWLALPTRAVERMAKDRTIPAVQLPDGSYLFEPAALTQWIQARRTGGPTDAAR